MLGSSAWEADKLDKEIAECEKLIEDQWASHSTLLAKMDVVEEQIKLLEMRKCSAMKKKDECLQKLSEQVSAEKMPTHLAQNLGDQSTEAITQLSQITETLDNSTRSDIHKSVEKLVLSANATIDNFKKDMQAEIKRMVAEGIEQYKGSNTTNAQSSKAGPTTQPPKPAPATPPPKAPAPTTLPPPPQPTTKESGSNDNGAIVSGESN